MRTPFGWIYGQRVEAFADHDRYLLLTLPAVELAERDQKTMVQRCLENGIRAFEAGDLDAAVDSLSTAVFHDANHFEALYHLGLAYQRRGQFELACADLARAVELRREHERVPRGYFVAPYPDTDEALADATTYDHRDAAVRGEHHPWVPTSTG